ncbi:MAG TPA: capsule assembly Wzi family protein, partial [Woeseiaceae bacterium]
MPFPARSTVFLLYIAALALPGITAAGPVIAPGDVGLRHDIQLLADYGVIRGPVTTWPLAWDAVEADLRRSKDEELIVPVAVERARDRLLARAERQSQRGRHRIKGRLALAEEPTRIRGFANTPREEAELSAGYSWFGDHLTVNLNVTGVDDPADGEDVRPDGSLIALELGNISIAASTMDRWWGPGWDGSQILSNNARPIPAFTIDRNRTDAFRTKWLSWIGPWDFSFIAGQMEKERVVPNTRFLGLRVSFKPHPAWEIGLSRTAQWCGDGRPCDWDTFWDLVWGRDNPGDEGVTPENEPSNQLAGIDIRVSNRWFGTPMAVYVNGTAEDEAGGFPSRYMMQGGIEGSGYIRSRWSYRWFAEYAYNALDVLKSDPIFDLAYNHGTYQTGYRYYGRVVGHGAENDARIASLGVILTNTEATTWELLLRAGDLNRERVFDERNTLTPTPQEIVSADIRFGTSTRFGRIEIGAGYEEIDDAA